MFAFWGWRVHSLGMEFQSALVRRPLLSRIGSANGSIVVRQLHLLPDLPFVLVARVGRLDHKGCGTDLQHKMKCLSSKSCMRGAIVAVRRVAFRARIPAAVRPSAEPVAESESFVHGPRSPTGGALLSRNGKPNIAMSLEPAHNHLGCIGDGSLVV